jgi:hypothetical protein
MYIIKISIAYKFYIYILVILIRIINVCRNEMI